VVSQTCCEKHKIFLSQKRAPKIITSYQKVSFCRVNKTTSYTVNYMLIRTAASSGVWYGTLAWWGCLRHSICESCGPHWSQTHTLTRGSRTKIRNIMSPCSVLMISVTYHIWSGPPVNHDTISLTQLMPIMPNRQRQLRNLGRTVNLITWCRPPTQKYQEALDGTCRLRKTNSS
jgi:hypothetical protein